MPAPSWENPADFLQVDEFALQVQLWRAGAQVRAFPAIFDEPSADASLGEYRHDTTTPSIMSTDAHLAGIVRGDEIRLADRRFDVMGSPAPDGTGWSRLRLAPQIGQGGR